MADLERDRKARLTAARMAQGDPEGLRLLLDALALWPGQEDKRRDMSMGGGNPMDVTAARRSFQ
jgi:hypothetical protein